MIIYFCDRELTILGHASTELPDGIRISQDKTTEDVESGVNTFECILTWDEDTRALLEQGITAGNYILKQSDTSYDALYQIVETESDTKAQEISLYAEDAGLDLLNTLCPATTLTNKTMYQMLTTFVPSDWTIQLWDVPGTTRTNEWDGESTCTERIRSVVGLWDCEMYFTFRIEGLEVREKILNVVQKRGNQDAIPQLRLNYDIDRIVTKTSIEDLVTALNVTGGTPDDSETPIDLKGYTYSYTDLATGDVYTVDKTTGQMRNLTAMDRWSSAIDADGLWVGSFSFDTTDKAVLAGQARAELQKLSAPAVNYEVDFAVLPDDVQIGDRVNIIDDDGGLYLEARLLQIETCEADDTKTATIGEYLLRDEGISQKVIQMASDLAKQRETDRAIQEQMSIITETVDGLFTLEVDSSVALAQAYLTARLLKGNKDIKTDYDPNWFKWILRSEKGEKLLGRGYTLTVDMDIIGYASTILCRFIRPQLYDLTDHNLVAITDQNLEPIQVSFAGIYNQPVVTRSALKSKKKALKATATIEVGDPTVSREVNLYDRGTVNETLQHVWASESGEDAGAHITEVTKEVFEAQPQGGNLLATSQGIKLRDGLEELALFGADGMRMGKEREKHITVTNTTFSVADEDGSVPFSVSTDGSLKTLYTGINTNIQGADGINYATSHRAYLRGRLADDKIYFGASTSTNMTFTQYIENPTAVRKSITVDGVTCSAWMETPSILGLHWTNTNSTKRYVGCRYTDQYYDTLVKVNDSVLGTDCINLNLTDTIGTSLGAGYSNIYTYGKIAHIRIMVYNTNSISAGSTIYDGTLADHFPVSETHLVGYYGGLPVIGQLYTTGELLVTNVSASDIRTTSTAHITLTGTYIFK